MRRPPPPPLRANLGQHRIARDEGFAFCFTQIVVA
jgi:hypothetical protein